MKLTHFMPNPRRSLAAKTPQAWLKWQPFVVIALIMLGAAAFLPWEYILQPEVSMALGFLLLAATTLWTQWRVTKLQIKLHHLEHRFHRLARQKSSMNINPKNITHLDAEHFFSPDQTRH